MASRSAINKDSGSLLVNDLSTLYSLEICKNCEHNHIVIFGLGEKQPSMWVCDISGIWSYKKIDKE